mgnify:CR=1 FL=1
MDGIQNDVYGNHIIFEWVSSGSFSANWSINVDPLSSVMLVVVTFVSALVHIYSIGYMSHDPHKPRFMSYLSLFTFSMLALVVSDNFLQLFFGWEGVGLCSYLLIGFWYKKESANNAACTGSFVPLLTLGIPGSGTTAILLGALIALNVSPGPRLMIDQPEIFWSVIISMYIGNIVLLILNLPLIPYIAKVLTVPRTFLIPFILFFTLMGAYIGQNNSTELLILVGMGVIATILRFASYPLAPLLIGFILGPMLEDNFSRATQLYDGISFVWERPLTTALLVIAVLLIILPAIFSRIKKEA